MKLYSTKTLIQAQKRLSANGIQDAVEALEKALRTSGKAKGENFYEFTLRPEGKVKVATTPGDGVMVGLKVSNSPYARDFLGIGKDIKEAVRELSKEMETVVKDIGSRRKKLEQELAELDEDSAKLQNQLNRLNKV